MSNFNPTEAAEVAEAAYKDLLHGPMPATPLDYRRAIMQAVLIGRTLEAAATGPWQTTQPDCPGVWEVACAESDFEPDRVRVFDHAGVLWVECPHIGTNTVDAYHHGLIDTRWRRTNDDFPQQQQNQQTKQTQKTQ